MAKAARADSSTALEGSGSSSPSVPVLGALVGGLNLPETSDLQQQRAPPSPIRCGRLCFVRAPAPTASSSAAASTIGGCSSTTSEISRMSGGAGGGSSAGAQPRFGSVSPASAKSSGDDSGAARGMTRRRLGCRTGGRRAGKRRRPVDLDIDLDQLFVVAVGSWWHAAGAGAALSRPVDQHVKWTALAAIGMIVAVDHPARSALIKGTHPRGVSCRTCSFPSIFATASPRARRCSRSARAAAWRTWPAPPSMPS